MVGFVRRGNLQILKGWLASDVVQGQSRQRGVGRLKGSEAAFGDCDGCGAIGDGDEQRGCCVDVSTHLTGFHGARQGVREYASKLVRESCEVRPACLGKQILILPQPRDQAPGADRLPLGVEAVVALSAEDEHLRDRSS